MKVSQRLDYPSLAAMLGQRGLVDPQRAQLMLATSSSSAIPFPEALIGEGLIGDWELSRVVCDLYGLPFLPIDVYTPSHDVLKGLDLDFLRTHRLVPLDRYANVLTVAMPGLVPADVLAQLAVDTDLHVMPVVGSVNGNNKWIAENMAIEPPAALPDAQPASAGGEWKNLFDQGNAAVMQNLGEPEAPPRGEPRAREKPSLPPLPPLPPLTP